MPEADQDAFRTTRVSGGLPPDIGTLRRESEAEGHRHVGRLVREWLNGEQRFGLPGEALLAVNDARGRTIAIGGLTRDPWHTDAYRMRRFYVLNTMRRHGIAGRIARCLLQQAPPGAPITAHAPTSQARDFWLKLSFRPSEAKHHNLILLPNELSSHR